MFYNPEHYATLEVVAAIERSLGQGQSVLQFQNFLNKMLNVCLLLADSIHVSGNLVVCTEESGSYEA